MRLRELHDAMSQDAEYLRAYGEEDLIHRVSERVYKLRLKLGMTQEELAERLNTQQPAIARIEAGFTNMKLRTVARLSYALDCRPEDLVNRETPVVLHEEWIREEDEEEPSDQTVVTVSEKVPSSYTHVLMTAGDEAAQLA